jgi:hypothetical protein
MANEVAPIMSWQEHVEGLVVGAMRGMAEAQAAMERATGGVVPPLDDITMFEASELMAATLLEASVACEEERAMPSASRKVGRDVLTYMKALRLQRQQDGVATLLKITEQAGLERQRPH